MSACTCSQPARCKPGVGTARRADVQLQHMGAESRADDAPAGSIETLLYTRAARLPPRKLGVLAQQQPRKLARSIELPVGPAGAC